MRVAIDVGPSLRNQTGVGRYASQLADHLELRGVEVERFAVALRGPTPGKTVRWRIPARMMQSSWRYLRGPSLRPLIGTVDIIHATNFVLPPTGGTPGVVTVHDLSFFRADVHRALHRLRDQVPWSIARAAAVIVP